MPVLYCALLRETRESQMGIIAIVILGLAILALVYLVMIYNNLVQVKHNVSKAWANIDVLLKQRHDELPKLVETCKQYMKFEQDTLQKVIDARSRVFSARRTRASRRLCSDSDRLARTVSGRLLTYK